MNKTPRTGKTPPPIPAEVHQYINSQPFDVLFLTLSGARVYGYGAPGSDYDLRGAHVLPLRNILGVLDNHPTITERKDLGTAKTDLVTHDIRNFINMLMEGNGYVLEQVFSYYIIHQTPYFEVLKELAQTCITKKLADHYAGYARKQFMLMQKQGPNCLKAMMNVYRILLSGHYVMKFGSVLTHLPSLNRYYKIAELDELLEVKQTGNFDFPITEPMLIAHTQQLNHLFNRFTFAAEKSELPQEVSVNDKKTLNEFLLSIKRKEIKLNY